RRNPMKSDELGWSRFTVSVNSAGAGWVAGGDTLRVPRRHAWVPSARRSEAVDQAPRPSVSPSGSGLIAAERDGLHLSRNGSNNKDAAAGSDHLGRVVERRLPDLGAGPAGGQHLARIQAAQRVEHVLDAAHQVERLGGVLAA